MDIRDVAKALKVSVATVSRALNEKTAHLVEEKTRARVRRFTRKVGYIPNRAAQELSIGKTHTLGLVLPNVLESIFFNDYLVKVLAGVYKTLDEDTRYNCKIIILPRGKVLAQLDQQVLTSGLDGLLLSPYCDSSLYKDAFPAKLLVKWKKPMVVMNAKVQHKNRFNCVYLDQTEAARKAITYLIQKGHRNIAMIQGDPFFIESEQRFKGYRRALEEHKIPYRSEFVGAGGFIIEGGYEATLSLFKGAAREVTAIFCANDEMAIGALKALRSLEIRCPQQVAVMGFDGLDLGNYVEPRLTSMSQPTHAIAERATRLLIELIENKHKETVSETLPPQIIQRESV